MTLRIAVVGLGKIARDQHLPAIAVDPDFELAATVDRHGGLPDVRNFEAYDALLASDLGFNAVSLCTPPLPRRAMAAAALAAGKHVMLEKPPASTVTEALELAAMARSGGPTLFATWHSREAAGVAEARRRLAGETVEAVEIEWREDVRRWHPGQQWIWSAGGMGVFDPGINALSILTEILPEPVFVSRSRLLVPSNRQAPIAAELALNLAGGGRGGAVFDWRSTPRDTWEVRVRTARSALTLADGGARLIVDGAQVDCPERAEYPGLYRRFAQLAKAGASDVDLRPLQLVADAFMLGETERTEPFQD
ncbi:MAG TPA: Gfo/Idh/MocA family oxidoreductase [Caulobacteraceae bacterium]|nr:Gfo/Idh/MocA family oxidoreductase [Caulobacteraceae bacterium]